MRLLLIGPLPPPIGGATVLFKQLADELLSHPDIQLHILNTARSSTTHAKSLYSALQVLLGIIRHSPQADIISFHASLNGALLFGPVIHLLCLLLGKKWIFRGFGGGFDSWYQRAPALSRSIFKLGVLRADTILLERQSSTTFFQRLTDRPVQWYANSRKCEPKEQDSTPINTLPAKRFVFVGHVKNEKGIREIIEAAQLINGHFLVDIYGPLDEAISAASLNTDKVAYRGVLKPDAVISTLTHYDVLLLPSYWKGEGYPGVILEAYCAGIPVIASRWGGIPEIVSDASGILIEPQDSRALAEAMEGLTKSSAKMLELRRGAAAMADKFSSTAWTKTFLDINRRLVRTDYPSK